MRYLLSFLMTTVVLSFFNSAYATMLPVTLDGTLKSFVEYDKPIIKNNNGKIEIITGQYVLFEKVKLSKAAQDWLVKHVHDKYTLPSSSLVAKVDLGMNGVPVLNQGIHGTCVTFATSAMLDAIIGHTDYVSQLCSLALGKYLHEINTNYPSGWDGTWSDFVLGQYWRYGVISVANQEKFRCGGRKNYPKKKSTTGEKMSAQEYGQRSENIMKNIRYRNIVSLNDMFDEHNPSIDANINIRTAVGSGHRVVIGFLLNTNRSHNGALGKYRVNHDSWVLSKAIVDDSTRGKLNAGHAVVITGYDDNAVIVDDDNIQHRGVYTVRNSWGKNVGDRGDFYMSYDYVSKLVTDAFEMMPV